jgi:hypothetical protein
MSEHEQDRDPHEAAEDAPPPAQRPPEDFGAEWVDPDDAAEEMEDETEGRS